MRLQHIIGAALSFAVFFLPVASASTEESTEPEIIVTAAFPESNQFGHVVNGEKNTLILTLENKSNRNVTLLNIAGSVHNPETSVLIKNLTTAKLGLELQEGIKLQLPYAFFSEFKTGDISLNVWLEHSVDGTTYRVPAYESIVTIVEPELSFFDFQLISTYLVVAAILGGLGYFAFITYVPQPKKSRTKKTSTTAAESPSVAVAATGAGGYQEEWIPDHHLKKTKTAKKSGGLTSGTSADELSAAEVSGTEGKKRKGRK